MMGGLQGDMMTGDNAGVLQHIFKQYDRHGKGELTPHEVQNLHGDIRMGGISYPQVLASMKYTCSTDTCTLDELYDLLQEMDRRFFLLQDLRWEFSLLDRDQRDTITVDQARWMVQAVHGKNFSKRKWSDFLHKRAIPGTRVAFQEIEVLLCNVKSSLDVLQDREDEERARREQEERERLAEEEALMEKERQRRLREEERRRKEQKSEDDSEPVQQDEHESEIVLSDTKVVVGLMPDITITAAASSETDEPVENLTDTLATATLSGTGKTVDNLIGTQATTTLSATGKTVDNLIGTQSISTLSGTGKTVDNLLGTQATATFSGTGKTVDNFIGIQATDLLSGTGKTVDILTGTQAIASLSGTDKIIDNLIGALASVNLSGKGKTVDNLTGTFATATLSGTGKIIDNLTGTQASATLSGTDKTVDILTGTQATASLSGIGLAVDSLTSTKVSNVVVSAMREEVPVIKVTDGEINELEVENKEKQRFEDEARRKMMEEEDERRRLQRQKEEEERLLEEQRLRQLEEEEARRRQDEMEKYKDAEKILEDTSLREKDLEEQLRIVREKLKVETDEKKRKELEAEEERLMKLLYDLKHKRIRYSLKVAIKEKDKYKLQYSIKEFKTEKVEDVDMDLEKAEKLLREITSRDNLRKAMSRREIEELEKAINIIKKNGLEVQLARELRDANEILARLRKIQRIRSEILELKQSTVAEIRSYQKPPPVVHTVMTATFIILGHQEREMKDWKNVQALVGKTGKEGLKRRCLECNAAKISTAAAARAKELLDKQELDEVRDVSAGAATFYVFSVAMVEESIDIAERGPIEPETSETPAPATKPKIDPTKMVISRSKKMVTTSGPSTRSRSKTPTRKK